MPQSFLRTTLAAGVALAMLGAVTAPLCAATVGRTLRVRATVTPRCTISTTPLAFGAVNVVAGAQVDAVGGLTITCTNRTAWSAAAGVGAGAGASYAARRMTSSANLLNYNIYTSATRTTVWGNGGGGTALIAGTGTGVAQAVTVYGRIPSGQTLVRAGSYADTVAVTVTY